jgi:uncharacterized membrane protein
MKLSDVEKIREAGLITQEQQEQIVQHFKLHEESSKLLAIISIVGGVLVTCGIALLIAANWNEIARGVKIAAGIVLMLGAHAGGWQLRERKGYPKTGEALHLVGSGLFLANIALIGQIYHISTRPPNAFLLWWTGIAALPWLLRSKAQHVLALLAFGIWFGFEVNQEGSPIYFGEDEYQILLNSLLGLVFVGAGYCLRRTGYADFASSTQKLGSLVFLSFFFPLTWNELYRQHWREVPTSPWILPVLAAVAVLLLAAGIKFSKLLPEWKWTWGLALLAMIGVIAGANYLGLSEEPVARGKLGYHSFAAVALFIFCLLQIQVGLQERSPYLVNLAVAFIALDIFATYLTLFGSMGQTGLVFLGGGVFLILFGIYLEKKRRALMLRIKTQPNGLAG